MSDRQPGESYDKFMSHQQGESYWWWGTSMYWVATFPAIINGINNTNQFCHNIISVADEVKWNRRKNLEGLSLRLVCMPFSIYTISMNPINSAGDEFDMNGMFADFWFNLQVRSHIRAMFLN